MNDNLRGGSELLRAEQNWPWQSCLLLAGAACPVTMAFPMCDRYGTATRGS